MKVRKKQYDSENVYDAALNRIRECYKRFDKVVVSFSGGKDSTAVLNLTITVAKELKKLPVEVVFVDEEAIHPPTIEYVERTRQRLDVDLKWFCLPVKHRNACSNEQPWWYCWNPSEKHLWVRELPACAITTDPAFKFGDSFQEWMPRMYPPSVGSVCVLTGIRTQESLRRYRVIVMKKNDHYVTSSADYKNSYRAFPIYDWSSEDVWRLVHEYNYDYNRTYDIFNRTTLYNKLLKQRVCPPYGEEPLRGLWVYAECFPELWHKMLYRVAGCATAWRYANTELYSNTKKPDSLTWRAYCDMVIETYPEVEYRDEIRKNIRSLVKLHFSKTDDEIEDELAHPITGCSWKFLTKIAVKGDFKGRQAGSMMQEAGKRMLKLGITLDEAIARYGKTANRQHGVDASGQPITEQLQPERGSTT